MARKALSLLLPASIAILAVSQWRRRPNLHLACRPSMITKSPYRRRARWSTPSSPYG